MEWLKKRTNKVISKIMFYEDKVWPVYFCHDETLNIKLTVEFREKLKYKVSGFQDDYVLGFGTTNDS